MGGIWQDLRYGLRMLAKGPGFTTVAVATLALGIGANTAILSIGKSVLYRSVPYRAPARLVVLWNKDLKGNANEMQMSVADLEDYQHRANSFEALSGFTWTDYQNFSITTDAGAERIRGLAVLPGLFNVVQLHPLIGREFQPDEFVGDKHVALLGYDVWRTRFGSDPGLVDRTVRVNREPYTVVGILPKNFELPVMDDGLQILVPLRLDGPDAINRKQKLVVGAGLLKPGRTLAQGRAEIEGIGKQLAAEYPEDARLGGMAEGLREIGALHDAKEKLPIFLATVFLMLLIAAANVAGILLSRFAARDDELVVRRALGASSGRLVRQLLTESMILTALAGAVAIVVAQWAGDLLISHQPFYMPTKPEHVVSGTAIAVMVALSGIVGVVFGLLPALAVTRTNLHEVMNRKSSRIDGGWWQDKMRNALIACEVAISVALIIGAGLMVNTVVRIAGVNIGFDPKGLTLARTSLDTHRYSTPAQQIAFYESLGANLSAQPGVEIATITSHFARFDPSGWDMGNRIRIPGRPEPESKAGSDAETTVVAPGFFSAMRMQMLRGREFIANEPVPAVIVDQTFADKFFPDKSPIGQHIVLLGQGMPMGESVKSGLRTIVGVVAPIRRVSYLEEPFPQLYVPLQQNPVPAMYAIVRMRNGSGAAAIRKVVAELDPELPVYWSATMKSWIDRFYGSQRFELLTMGAFALVALLISASGLYAVISFRVSQRTRELGVRLALGARRGDVEWLMLRQAGVVIVAGLLIGLAAASAIGQLLSKFLFGVRPHDPLTRAAGAALVLLISVVAVYVPTRRASNMEPLVALRYE